MSRRKKIVAALLAITVIGVTAVGCAETPEASSASDEPVAVETEAPAEETTEEKPEKAEEPVAEEAEEAPEYTTAQENAIASAEDYLDTMAFSRNGLIEQLSSEYGEGFSKADAKFAVNHIDVNWNEQAAKSAKDYLETMAFSRSGLIEQLESEFGDGLHPRTGRVRSEPDRSLIGCCECPPPPSGGGLLGAVACGKPALRRRASRSRTAHEHHRRRGPAALGQA